jgi:hypothetical protein
MYKLTIKFYEEEDLEVFAKSEDDILRLQKELGQSFAVKSMEVKCKKGK